MSTRPVDVDSDIKLRLLLPEQPAQTLPVSLRYDSVDPYAVTVLFQGAEDPVSWVFARDLLADGLDGTEGVGDVVVRPVPTEDHVIISLASPDGRAELEADAGDLREFLDRTEQVVPRGQEPSFVDLDAELASLLRS